MFVFDLHWPEPEFAHHLEQRLKLMATDMIEACVKRYSWNDHSKIGRHLKINTGGVMLACRGISIPESCHKSQGSSKEIMTHVYFQLLAISNLATSRKHQREFLYLWWIDPWKWINQVWGFFFYSILVANINRTQNSARRNLSHFAHFPPPLLHYSSCSVSSIISFVNFRVLSLGNTLQIIECTIILYLYNKQKRAGW